MGPNINLKCYESALTLKILWVNSYTGRLHFV